MRKLKNHQKSKTASSPAPDVIAFETAIGLERDNGINHSSEGRGNERQDGFAKVVNLFPDGRPGPEGTRTDSREAVADGDIFKRLEDLAKANEQLYLLQAQTREEAEATKAALLEIDRTMERICTTLADELHGPVRTMAGFAQLLLKENGWSMSADGRNYAERLAESATKMDRIVLDLLEYGRMSCQELVCENIPLEECICEAMGSMTRAIAAKNAVVQMEHPFPKAWGNRPTLRGILARILDHMLQLPLPDPPPSLRIRAETHPTSIRVCIEWKDGQVEGTGPITTSVTSVAPTEANCNLGIGMAMVERGIAKMGGRVGAEFEPGKSSRFWIELRHPRQEG